MNRTLRYDVQFDLDELHEFLEDGAFDRACEKFPKNLKHISDAKTSLVSCDESGVWFRIDIECELEE